MDYQLQEGGITLSKDFHERTFDMFFLENYVSAPLSITLSRDTHAPDDDVNTYVQGQPTLLISRPLSDTALARNAVSISNSDPAPYIETQSYYLDDTNSVSPRQKAFMFGGGQVVMFSCTDLADVTEQQNIDLNDLTANFLPKSERPLNTVKE